ncbi:MAG: stage III sporulation protein AD [Clostridia bacterium]|nr:stage III sporulation protein AD [Clostridia bacterium]
MVEIFKVIGLALITTIAVIVVKQVKPEMAIFVGLAGTIIVFLYIIDLLEQVFDLFNYILEVTNINSEMFTILLKIVGVGYITEIGANICSDSGNSAIATKVQLAGKLIIFVLAIPIITNLVEMITELLV